MELCGIGIGWCYSFSFVFFLFWFGLKYWKAGNVYRFIGYRFIICNNLHNLFYKQLIFSPSEIGSTFPHTHTLSVCISISRLSLHILRNHRTKLTIYNHDRSRIYINMKFATTKKKNCRYAMVIAVTCISLLFMVVLQFRYGTIDAMESESTSEGIIIYWRSLYSKCFIFFLLLNKFDLVFIYKTNKK